MSASERAAISRRGVFCAIFIVFIHEIGAMVAALAICCDWSRGNAHFDRTSRKVSLILEFDNCPVCVHTVLTNMQSVFN